MSTIFTHLDTLLELPGMIYIPGRNFWECACYIDGTPHKQKDKTKIKEKNGYITIYEQGGEIMSLYQYLIDYRNMSKSNAFKLVTEKSDIDIPELKNVCFEPVKPIYVPGFTDCFPIKRSSNLYKYLCSYFYESEVDKVFDMYNVGEKGDISIFWHIDRNNNICYDYNVPYLVNGHRDKERGAFRKFQVGKGYTGKALFGEHLLNGNQKQTYIVESQKTAIIMSLFFSDKLFLATGGSMQLNAENARGHLLLPDYDFSVLRWEKFGRCINIDDQLMEFFRCYEKVKVYKMKEMYSWFGSDISDEYMDKIGTWRF